MRKEFLVLGSWNRFQESGIYFIYDKTDPEDS
jgi:hypothetical protein